MQEFFGTEEAAIRKTIAGNGESRQAGGAWEASARRRALLAIAPVYGVDSGLAERVVSSRGEMTGIKDPYLQGDRSPQRSLDVSLLCHFRTQGADDDATKAQAPLALLTRTGLVARWIEQRIARCGDGHPSRALRLGPSWGTSEP
jgi:hypothetical protein